MGTPMWGLPTERRKPRAEGRGPLEDVAVDPVEDAESVAEAEELAEDAEEAEVAAGAEAGFTGVGTTVCSGLDSGRPPGYES